MVDYVRPNIVAILIFFTINCISNSLECRFCEITKKQTKGVRSC